MHRFTGILFKVQTLDTDIASGAICHINAEHALADNRLFELADLIALR